MILEKSFASAWLSTAAKRTSALFVLLLLTCGPGCASSGTLQPHHAFRQATTPYQGYYQGQQSFYGAASGLAAPASGDYAGYGEYNNSLPGYGQPDVATGSYGAYGNQFANPSANLNGGQVQAQGNYQQYSPNAGYSYQPAYNGGFTSGTC